MLRIRFLVALVAVKTKKCLGVIELVQPWQSTGPGKLLSFLTKSLASFSYTLALLSRTAKKSYGIRYYCHIQKRMS